MNPPEPVKKSKITRLAFLLRFALVIAAAVVISIALKVALILSASNGFLIVLMVLAGLALLFATLYLYFWHAVFPRLRDIGLYGPFCTVVALLWFVPPLNPFVTLALLLVPANAIPEKYTQT